MKNNISICLLLVCSMVSLHAAKVGLLVMATGRYIEFVEPLLASADANFLPHHEVTYFIFTDQPITFADRIARSIVRIEQGRLGWPYDTLMRLPIYWQHRDLYDELDYLYALDADMLFVDTVGDEILSERVATLHPGFVGTRGTYETNAISAAYIAPHEGTCYFCGGFNGGSKDAFLHMAATVYMQITQDLERNFIAIWHDESHVNRYFVDNPPTAVLNPSYCYPGRAYIPYPKKIIALDKDHAAYRAE